MKIRFSKEGFISFLVLLPYFAGRISNQLFYIRLSPNAYIMPTMGIMFLFMVLFLVLNLTKWKRIRPSGYSWLLGLILLDAALGISLTQDKITAVSVWLWLCTPMVLSLMIVKYCRMNCLDYAKILEGMLKWFTLYTVLMLGYFVLFRGVFSSSSVRFDPRGGGAVIFGYTIAVVFALALCIKSRFQPRLFYLILIALSIGALATGSRGAVWPICLLWALNFLLAKVTPKKIIIALALTAVAMLLSATDIFSLIGDFSQVNGNMWAKLFRTSSSERESTFQGVFRVIASLSTSKSILGYGTGGLFPIQRWELMGGDMSNHYFSVQGESLLVQPHNTFLYALMENGWVGFFLWLLLFIYVFKVLIKNKNENYIYQIAFVGTIIFVNLFDSIMFIQPGVATVIWLLLWLMCEESQTNAKRMTISSEELHDK